MGTPSYGVDYEGQYDFLQIGTITVAEAALGVDERDNASVDALAAVNKVIWRPDAGTAAAILRFRTDGSEDDAPIIEMYAAKGADYYTRIGTLTLAQGTQDWSGGHFVDEITLSNEAWGHGIRADSVTDEVGRVLFNTGGFDRFLFIASTLAVTTVHIDIARLDKQIDHGIEIHSAILVLADNMTVSDVVSAISDMHSDLAAANDGLSAQMSSLMTDVTLVRSTLSDTIATDLTGIQNQNSSILTSLDTLEDAISDGCSNIVDQNSSIMTDLGEVKTAVELVRSTLSDTIATDLTGIQNQLSSLMTDTGEVKTAVSAGISDLVDQNSSMLTQFDGLSAQLSTLEDDVELVVVEVSDAASHLESVLNDELEAHEAGVRSGVTSALSNAVSELIVNDDLIEAGTRSGVKSALVDQETGLRSGTLSALDLHEAGTRSGVKSALIVTDVAIAAVETEVKSAADSIISTLVLHEAGTRSGIKSVMTDNETAMRSAITSALSNAVSELIVNDDLIEAGIRSGVMSAITVQIAEISDAISNLKDEVTAHGDIGLISGPETVTVTSNTQTLSELGLVLDTNIRRVTLIPDTSGIYWADGAAVYGTNPFPNAVTQIDCTKAQIITREFVVSDGTTQDMQVVQEG